jgi:hypothetical protein
MKPTMILTAALFLFSHAQAQTAQFGIKGGLNASELHVEGNSSLKTRIAFHAGILAHIHASETWAIQPEILYSAEGAKGKDGNTTSFLNLGYLNIPVLLQYMFDNGFRIEGGPQMGFLVSAKTKTGGTSVDVKDNYKSTAFSIPLGIGYLTMNGLGFDARYVFGLSNINTDTHPVVQSNVFQFGIFYQFKKMKKR